jgi:hypothetical protein
MVQRGIYQQAKFNEFSAAHIWHIAGYGPDDCEQGSSISNVVGKNMANKQYVVPSSTWPYDPKDPKTSLNQIPAQATLMQYGVAHIQETFLVPEKDISSVKNAIAGGYPVVISVPVYWDSGWKSDGNIQSPTPDDTISGFHAITILSYDDGAQSFKFINSWGQAWGVWGFGTLTYEFVQNYSRGGMAVGKLDYKPTDPPGPVPPEAFVCAVRANAGYLYSISNGVATNMNTNCAWNGCNNYGYPESGEVLHPDGFYLCARPDLIAKRFYVGNVVDNAGYYYALQNGAVTDLGQNVWNYCETGSLIGTDLQPNGFWVCLEQ